MKIYRKIVDLLYKIIMYSVSVVLGLMIIVAFLEVIRRYCLGKSFIWADDFIRYLIIYVGFIGGAAAYKDDNLASLDLVTRLFPTKVQVVLEIIYSLRSSCSAPVSCSGPDGKNGSGRVRCRPPGSR